MILNLLFRFASLRIISAGKKVKNLNPTEFFIEKPMILASGTHSFTNYAVGFIEQLDYIFVSDGFEVVKWAECVGREAVEPYIAMPNENMGSDHSSVICDIKLKIKV